MAQVRNRDYEVSIWTLQDEFISVLKPTGVVNKGQIEKPNMKIVDDGTQEFTFSIPMYIISNGQRVENPIWKNTRDGNIIADMRKIKVTFNRGRSKEKTFEFLITDVTERHENDQLYCDVNCEGMAFHELGKRGYSIKLLTEDFYLENERYFSRETGPSGKLLVGYEPKPTLSYWLNKFLPEKPIVGADPRLWYYKIEMDWSGYAKSAQRKTNEVYEEEYVSSWKLQQDSEGNEVYAPNQVEALKVKERLVDLKESNIYNLTQDLAETFGVFCRYEYEHDDNLEITGRTVVFYNNYMREREGYIDITYPFETAAITRTRDSKDLTTKMFVTSVEDENAAGGVLTIMDVDANKSREEYLLNFDYLYSIGSITVEQYQEIQKYETAVGKINIELGNIIAPLLSLQNQVTDLEAEITIRQNSIDAAKESYSRVQDEENAFTGGDGTIEYTWDKPQLMSFAVTKDGDYYITFTEHGVLPETVKIYTEKNSLYDLSVKLDSEVKGIFEFEGNTGFVNKVSSIDMSNVNPKPTIAYVAYSYNPKQYWATIKQTYETRQAIDETSLKQAQERLDNLNRRIKEYQIRQENLLADKQKLIKKFDDMMGPAIRESYWQPDNYDDYGDNYTDSLTFNSKTTVTPKGSSGLTQLLWDTNLFQDEQKAYYEESVNLDKYYYPVILIDTPDKLKFVKENYDKLSVMFYDVDAVGTNNTITEKNEKDSNLRQYVLGSSAYFCFVKKSETEIVPAIIVTGAAELIGGRSFEGTNKRWVNSLRRFMAGRVVKISDDSSRADNSLFQTTVGVVTTEIVNGKVQYSIKKGWSLNRNSTNSGWANYKWNSNINTSIIPNRYDNERYTSSIELCYPRIKIGSLSLKTSEDQLAISYAGETLKNNDDYYILTRDDSEWNSKNELEVADSAYYITLKPETMVRLGTYTGNVGIRFCISNANVSIYLDALQIMKENSQPKVSYTVDVSFVDFDFIYDLYNKLNRICNINDHELHFENVQGYISEINLDCDVPANDSIEVKNYKTKFEDLFSTIVAQTQSMKKSEYAIGLATSAFTVNGDLADKVMESSWRRMDLNLAFNKGKLTINEADGIWGMSEDGVVAFRGGGIFTATKKDDLGNWIWNTGILPQGINADLITTGRLDTNKINIYAGNNVRLQLNSEGLFAYKNYFDKTPYYIPEYDTTIDAQYYILQEMPEGEEKTRILEGLASDKTEDLKQFVTFNREGLFLVAKKGSVYYDDLENEFKILAKDHINRVSISWDGLTLRDWNNDKVFYADMRGNLTIRGHLQATSLTIKNNNDEYSDINTYISSVAQKGVYYGASAPSSPVAGDLWYNTGKNSQMLYNGSSWQTISVSNTFLTVDPNNGVIQMGATSHIDITGNSSININSGQQLNLTTAGALNIFAGTSTSGTAAITLKEGELKMNASSKLLIYSGDFTVNSTNILLNGSSLTIRTLIENPYSLYTALKIDSDGFYTTNREISAYIGQGAFSIFKGVSINDPESSIFSVNADGASTTNLEVGDLEISGTLSFNGKPFIIADNVNNQNYFSNKKIIYAETKPTNEHDVIWLEPSGDSAPTPTSSTVTLKSGTIDSRKAISSGSFTSDALTFSDYATIQTGSSYTYTASIKVYGTGSGSRTIKKNTSILKFNSSISLKLQKDVVITPGSEKTLVFTAELTSKPSNNNNSWTIMLDSEESNAYVNLQKNVKNTLQITTNGGDSGQSSSSSDVVCTVHYIP